MRQIERSKTNKSYWTKMFIISILALLVILGLRYGIYYGFGLKLETMFTPGIQQAEFPAQCYASTSGIAGTSFSCPSDASSCSAIVTLVCNTPTGNLPQVIFRGSSQSGLPSQIVADFNQNEMLELTEVYTKGTTQISCSGSIGRSDILITYLPGQFQSNYVYIYNGDLRVCDVASGKSFKYNQGGTLSTSNVPLAGESCDYSQGFIRCLSNTINAFQCSRSTTGSVIRTISDAKSAQWTKSETIPLSHGDTIGWASGNIAYTINTARTSECTKNVKAGTASNTYYECINDNGCGKIDRTSVKSCGGYLFDSNTGNCVAPTQCVASNGQTLNKNEGVCIDTLNAENCITPATVTKIICDSGQTCLQSGTTALCSCPSAGSCTGNTCTSDNKGYYTCSTGLCRTKSSTSTPCPANSICSQGACTYNTCTASNGTIIAKGSKICTDIYTLESCVNPPTITQTLVTTSDQICQGGVISGAYTANINVVNPIVSVDEQFNVDFQLTDTTSNKNVPVTITILKNSQVLSTVTQLTGNTVLNAGKTSFAIDAPPVGTYTLRVTFPFVTGNFKQDYVVQVSQALSVIIKADDLIQFDISPIVVYINSFQSGNYKALTNYEVSATYNGVKVNQWTTSNPSLGILKLTFTGLRGDGTLSIKARGEDESGLWTSWTDPFDVSVKKSTILFTSNFPTDICTQTQTLTFETKDSQGNYVDTQNTITINIPDGTKATVSATALSTGKYEFSYAFSQGGTYIVRITSSNANLGSSQLNNGNGELVNILSGAACGSNGGGDGGGTNWTLILIIGGLVAGVGMFIYFVFIKKSKK